MSVWSHRWVSLSKWEGVVAVIVQSVGNIQLVSTVRDVGIITTGLHPRWVQYHRGVPNSGITLFSGRSNMLLRLWECALFCIKKALFCTHNGETSDLVWMEVYSWSLNNFYTFLGVILAKKYSFLGILFQIYAHFFQNLAQSGKQILVQGFAVETETPWISWGTH